jgi:hypothetical protein
MLVLLLVIAMKEKESSLMISLFMKEISRQGFLMAKE